MPTLRARIASRSRGISCFKGENPFFARARKGSLQPKLKLQRKVSSMRRVRAAPSTEVPASMAGIPATFAKALSRSESTSMRI